MVNELTAEKMLEAILAVVTIFLYKNEGKYQYPMLLGVGIFVLFILLGV